MGEEEGADVALSDMLLCPITHVRKRVFASWSVRANASV